MATKQIDRRRHRGADLPGVGRQAIEGNPLTPDEIAMFEMLEREGWSPERRRAHIRSLGKPKKDGGQRESDDPYHIPGTLRSPSNRCHREKRQA